MRHCRPEGMLRAWLDRELPPAEHEEISAHLAECAACHRLCTELEARATCVGALLQALETAAPPAARPRPSHRWVPAAVALAAGLALTYYLMPRRPEPHLAGTPAPAAKSAASLVQAAAPPAPSNLVKTSAPTRVRRVSSTPEEFIALDDEPFESGLIVRVDVPDTNVQADVVFSPDGRARAYRLLQSSSRKSNKERNNE